VFYANTQSLLFDTEHDKLDWPIFQPVSLKEALEWVHYTTSRRASETSARRALAAYSRTGGPFPKADYDPNFLYTMIAIEAIYSKGRPNVKAALEEKVYSFIGRPRNTDRLFKHVYEHRSKIVHGSSRLSFMWNQDENIDLSDRSRFHRCSTLATAIIVSTLQKMISIGAVEIGFELTAVGAEKEAYAKAGGPNVPAEDRSDTN
jgi:hypothetical protein